MAIQARWWCPCRRYHEAPRLRRGHYFEELLRHIEFSLEIDDVQGNFLIMCRDLANQIADKAATLWCIVLINARWSGVQCKLIEKYQKSLVVGLNCRVIITVMMATE